MKTVEEIRTFAEGYHSALRHQGVDITDVDDWVLWGGYDLNIFGAYLADGLADVALRVAVYPGDWEKCLPPELHIFDIGG